MPAVPWEKSHQARERRVHGPRQTGAVLAGKFDEPDASPSTFRTRAPSPRPSARLRPPRRIVEYERSPVACASSGRTDDAGRAGVEGGSGGHGVAVGSGGQSRLFAVVTATERTQVAARRAPFRMARSGFPSGDGTAGRRRRRQQRAGDDE